MKLKKLIKFFNEQGIPVTIEDLGSVTGYVTQGKALFPFSNDDNTVPTLRQVMCFWDEAICMWNEGYLPSADNNGYLMVKEGTSSYYEWDSDTNTFELQEYEEPSKDSLSIGFNTSNDKFKRFYDVVSELMNEDNSPFIYGTHYSPNYTHSMTIHVLDGSDDALLNHLHNWLVSMAAIQGVEINFEQVN